MNARTTTASQSQNVLVLGAGNFGTCLAQHLAGLGHQITIWTIDDQQAQAINSTHRNPLFLSNVMLSDRISATNKIHEKIVSSSQAMVIAIPTQAMREVLTKFKKFLTKDVLIVCAAKGIEIGTLKLPQDIIGDALGEDFVSRACFLSGPSFAEEVAEQQPTAVSMASLDEDACHKAQELFHSDYFRVYRSSDPVGLEIAGAMKNVIAIAAGAVTGLGFQNNTRAAIITRGLAEMSRMGIALGANPLTFTGLGGVGDLLLTCSSEKSRNFTVGYRLGRGESVDQVLGSMSSVAEGVFTAKSVRGLMERTQVSVPICEQVYEVIYEKKPIKEAVQALLAREPKAELAGIRSP